MIYTNVNKFSEAVNSYGFAVIIKGFKQGKCIDVQSNYIPINTLKNDDTFSEYLHKITSNFNLDKLNITAKQRNGNNAYKNPKTFIWSKEETQPYLNGTNNSFN